MSRPPLPAYIAFFLGLGGVLSILLKLTGEISWPWLWVLLPLWIVPLVMGCLFVTALPMALWFLANDRSRAARKRL